VKTNSEKTGVTIRANKIHQEDELLTNFSVLALGSIGSSRDSGHPAEVIGQYHASGVVS
jgi:hypothetical protein